MVTLRSYGLFQTEIETLRYAQPPADDRAVRRSLTRVTFNIGVRMRH